MIQTTNSWKFVLPEKLAWLFKKFPVLYKLPRFIIKLQEPANGSHSDPDKFSPHPQTLPS
jgi:hypothetical protein